MEKELLRKLGLPTSFAGDSSSSSCNISNEDDDGVDNDNDYKHSQTGPPSKKIKQRPHSTDYYYFDSIEKIQEMFCKAVLSKNENPKHKVFLLNDTDEYLEDLFGSYLCDICGSACTCDGDGDGDDYVHNHSDDSAVSNYRDDGKEDITKNTNYDFFYKEMIRDPSAPKKKAQDTPARIENKFFPQRYDLLHRWDDGVKFDAEGWFSITPEKIANYIANKRLSNGRSFGSSNSNTAAAGNVKENNTNTTNTKTGLIWDAFVGVGGNTIAFAKTTPLVIGTDLSRERLLLAKNNCFVYSVYNYEFIQADMLQMKDFWRVGFGSEYGGGDGIIKTETEIKPESKRNTQPFDSVFLSPPWGGLSYKDRGEWDPLTGLPFSFGEMMKCCSVMADIKAHYLPKNTDFSSFFTELLGLGCPDKEGGQIILIERHWISSLLKVIMLYHH